MKASKVVLFVVTALLVLSFMAGPVRAQDEPPAWDGDLPNISEMTPRYDEGFPPEPISVDGFGDPVSPIEELVYSRLPKLYFNRDYYATMYRVEIFDFMTGDIYTVKGPGTCDAWYCYLQPPTKLSTYNEPTTGGVFVWRVQEKAFGSWNSWSDYNFFYVMSKGFSSTFDADRLKWQDVYGTWTLKNGYLKTLGTSPHLWDSVMQREYFKNFDYTVTMKRKGVYDHASGVIILGIPNPLDSNKEWNDGYYFLYGNNQVWGVWKNINGAITWMSGGWVPEAAIKPYDWNTLRLVGNYPYLDFWINGTYTGWFLDTSFSYGMVGVTMYDSWEEKDPLLVDQAVMIADQSVSTWAHDPAMQLNAEPWEGETDPGIATSNGDATGTR